MYYKNLENNALLQSCKAHVLNDLPPWSWPQEWSKHVEIRCVYKIYVCLLAAFNISN